MLKFMQDSQKALQREFDFSHQDDSHSKMVQERVASTHTSQYSQEMNFCFQTSKQQQSKWRAALSNDGIQYNQQATSCQLIEIQMTSHSINFQVLTLKVRCGPFQLSMNILNSLDCRPLNKKEVDAAGNFGWINFIKVLNQSYAVKCFPFQENNMEAIITDAIKQYFFLKIASALQIGPKLPTDLFFDLIIYSNSVEFLMERCKLLHEVKYSRFMEDDLKQTLFRLHTFKIVHLDVKSDNIAYSPSFKKLVLLDFGFSSCLEEQMGLKTKTFYTGSLKYSSPQMMKVYLCKQAEYVDLYYNDLFGLLASLKEIRIAGSYIQQELQQYVELPFSRIIADKYEIVMIKLLLFNKKFQTAFQILKDQIPAMKLKEQINKFMKQLEMSSGLSKFQQKAQFSSIERNKASIRLKVIIENQVRVDQHQSIQTRVDFLGQYQIRNTQTRKIKARERIIAKEILLDDSKISSCTQEIYYKLFVSFIAVNSNEYRSSPQEKDNAVRIFFNFIKRSKAGYNFIQQYLQRYSSDIAENQEMDLCLCYLLSRCSSSIQRWRQELFVSILQQIVLNEGGSGSFLKGQIACFIENRPTVESAICCLAEIEAIFEWIGSFYYYIFKYTFSFQSFFADCFKKIDIQRANSEEKKIIQIYQRFHQQVHQGRSSFEYQADVKSIGFINFNIPNYKKRFQLYIINCLIYHFEETKAIDYALLRRMIEILSIQQMKTPSTIKYYSRAIYNYLWLVKEYDHLLRYYSHLRSVLETSLLGKMKLPVIVLQVQYKCKLISIEQYISSLHSIYANSNRRPLPNTNIEQIYIVSRFKASNKEIDSDLLSKIQFLESTIRLEENDESIVSIIISNNLLRLFRLYHLIHQDKVQKMNKLFSIANKVEVYCMKLRELGVFNIQQEVNLLIFMADIKYKAGRTAEAIEILSSCFMKFKQNTKVSSILVSCLFHSIYIKYQSPSFNKTFYEDIHQLHSIIDQQNNYEQYFALSLSMILIRQTALVLISQSCEQFIKFVMNLTHVLCVHPSEYNINSFFTSMSDALTMSDALQQNIGNVIADKAQKISEREIRNKPYVCLFYALLIKFISGEKQYSFFIRIAQLLQNVNFYAKTIVLFDYYNLFLNDSVPQRKKQILQRLHYRSGKRGIKFHQFYEQYRLKAKKKQLLTQKKSILQAIKKKSLKFYSYSRIPEENF